MIKVNVKRNDNKVYELVIKGHAGYEYNELADQLATGEVKEIIHG